MQLGLLELLFLFIGLGPVVTFIVQAVRLAELERRDAALEDHSTAVAPGPRYWTRRLTHRLRAFRTAEVPTVYPRGYRGGAGGVVAPTSFRLNAVTALWLID